MAVSIGSLRYDIVADTSKFTKAIVATRSDLSLSNKLFRESRTPVEQYGLAIEKLESLYKKGAINNETYRRSVEKVKKEFSAVSKEAGKSAGFTSQISSAFKSIPASIKNAATAFVGFRLGSSILNSIKTDLQEIDNLAKQSRKLGIDTKELAGLRLAAEELSGVATTQFDTAMQRMTRRISEAAAGAGEAQGALEELGLSAEKLNQQGPTQSFLDIAQAMGEITNEQDRLRLAFKLFDSEGAALVTTLSAGADEIQRMIDRADELGLAVDFKMAEEVEKANDAITEMEGAIKGLSRTFTTTFAPALTAVMNGLQAFIKRFQNARDRIADFVEKLGEMINSLRTPILGGNEELEAKKREVEQRINTRQDLYGGYSVDVSKPGAPTIMSGPNGAGFVEDAAKFEALQSKFIDSINSSLSEGMTKANERVSTSVDDLKKITTTKSETEKQHKEAQIERQAAVKFMRETNRLLEQLVDLQPEAIG